MRFSLQELEKKIHSARSEFLKSVSCWVADESDPVLDDWYKAVQLTNRQAMQAALFFLNPSFVRTDCEEEHEGLQYLTTYYSVADQRPLLIKLCYLTNVFELLFQLEETYVLEPLTMDFSSLDWTLLMAQNINKELPNAPISQQVLADYDVRYQQVQTSLHDAASSNAAFLEECKRKIDTRLLKLISILDYLKTETQNACSYEKNEDGWLRRCFYYPWDLLFTRLINDYLFGEEASAKTEKGELVVSETVLNAYCLLFKNYHDEALLKLSVENTHRINAVNEELHTVYANLVEMERTLQNVDSASTSSARFFKARKAMSAYIAETSSTYAKK